jgi:amino acid transporter
MAFIAVLYIGVQVVAEGVLGSALGASAAPLADAVRGVSPALGGLLVAGAAVSMLGYLAGDALSAPRVIYAFARDGYLPKVLAAVGRRRGAPFAAVAAHLTLAAVLAISGAFAELAVLSSLAVAAVYIIGCVSAVVLQRRNVARAGEPLRLVGLELAAGVGVLGMIWITLQAEPAEALALGGAVLVSLLWYWLVRRPGRGAKRPA